MDNSFFDEHQKILKTILTNLKKRASFPHAFLLKGFPDSPTLDAAKYVACFLGCKHNKPCFNCNYCNSIINESCPDLIVLDGSKNIIKKEAILNIKKRFSKSSIADNNNKIYIINYVEHMSDQSVNSLLKFLEDPSDDCYAILTSKNLSNVPQTIVSRCMLLSLKKAPKNKLISKCIDRGVPLEDALILSNIFSKEEMIYEIYNQEHYKDFKNLSLEILEKILNKESILFFAQTELSSYLRDKNKLFFFLQILEVLFKDSINSNLEDKISFKSNLDLLKKAKKEIPSLEKKLFFLLEYKERVFSNINISLFLDSLFIQISNDREELI